MYTMKPCHKMLVTFVVTYAVSNTGTEFYLRMKNAATPNPIPKTNKPIPIMANSGDRPWTVSGTTGVSAAVSELG